MLKKLADREKPQPEAAKMDLDVLPPEQPVADAGAAAAAATVEIAAE